MGWELETELSEREVVCVVVCEGVYIQRGKGWLSTSGGMIVLPKNAGAHVFTSEVGGGEMAVAK